MERLEHNCGLVLVHAQDGLTHTTGLALEFAKHQENRGQDAAGIARKTLYGLHVHKELGRIDRGILDTYEHTAHAAATLIHNRYKTNGENAQTLAAAQPFAYGTGKDRFAFAHNGNVEMEPLLQYLRASGGDLRNIQSDSDAASRCLLPMLADTRHDISQAVRMLWPHLDGSHNGIALMANGSAAAWRDERGTHPLFFTQHDQFSIFTSEDNPIYQILGHNVDIREVHPGELILCPPRGKPITQQIADALPAHCIFEWWYFLKRLSSMAKTRADSVRTRAGEALADQDSAWLEYEKHKGGKGLLVVPVPHSALATAAGYKDAARLRGVDAITRNLDAPRTFISATEIRTKAVEEKYDIDPDLINGRDTILIDDSIVRGTTLETLIKYVRSIGKPNSIHVRISFPPVYAPCFYGIDMSTLDELFATEYRQMFANGASMEEVERKMAKDLGADSLRFLSTARVADVIQLPDNQLCHGCTRGNYPTETGQRRYDEQVAAWEERQKTSDHRE